MNGTSEDGFKFFILLLLYLYKKQPHILATLICNFATCFKSILYFYFLYLSLRKFEQTCVYSKINTQKQNRIYTQVFVFFVDFQ